METDQAMTDPKTPEAARQKLENLGIRWSKEVFMSFVLTGHTDYARLFLTGGMSPETSDKNGITALMWSAGRGHTEIVALILKQGASVNAQTSKGKTALMSAAYYGKEEPLKLLLEHGARAGLSDGEGKTAYDRALERKYSVIAKILKNGSNPCA